MKLHYIVRGVCIVDDWILLAKDVDATNTFLPGGHVEFGENAMDALVRELAEELGVRAEIQGFMGAVEHFYISNDRQNHEINLVFAFTSEDLQNKNIKPESREPHLQFFWSPLAQLHQHNLLPSVLHDILDDPAVKWASTIQRAE